MKVAALVSCCLVVVLSLAVSSATAVQIHTVQRDSTSNSYVLYDDHQMLVVDCGKVPIDTKGIVDAVNLIKSSNPTIRLNGIFITHGHPDHAANAYSVQKALGGPRVFVGSPQIKNELLNLINIFAKFDDPSSPGNPRGNSTNKWDYVNQIIAVQSRDEIWDTDDVELITDAEFNSVAETDHFAILYLPNDNAMITGDLVYVRAHLFMGFDVNFVAQCDWISALLNLKTNLNASTVLYPGHGSPSWDISATQIIQENIDYIQFARTIYATTCDVSSAVAQIDAKFPNHIAKYLLTILSAPTRVPADAMSLGCACSATGCNQPPPPCSFKGPEY